MDRNAFSRRRDFEFRNLTVNKIDVEDIHTIQNQGVGMALDADFSVPDDTWHVIPFNFIDYDDLDGWNFAVQDAYRVKRNGRWQVKASIRVLDIPDNTPVRLRITGISAAGPMVQYKIGGFDTIQITDERDVDAGSDVTIEIQIDDPAGGTVRGSRASTRFQMNRTG